jgi:hypothetical protein
MSVLEMVTLAALASTEARPEDIWWSDSSTTAE